MDIKGFSFLEIFLLLEIFYYNTNVYSNDFVINDDAVIIIWCIDYKGMDGEREVEMNFLKKKDLGN